MIRYNSKIVPEGYIGITIWPFIFIKYNKEYIIKSRGIDYYNKLINHEKIHLRQQIELLVIPFYILYILNWVINIFVTRYAYKNICFEREAYINEKDTDYLQNRKMYSFIKYIQ